MQDNGAHIFFCGLKGMMPGIQDMLQRVAKVSVSPCSRSTRCSNKFAIAPGMPTDYCGFGRAQVSPGPYSAAVCADLSLFMFQLVWA